jgi:aryl-alcohol dehydrogenase-like predicted oxidoreductase/ADP-heptose:LPS heptosyltransferase
MNGLLVVCLLNARGDYLLNLPALRAISRVAKGQLLLLVRRGACQVFLRDVPASGAIEVDAQYQDGGYEFDVDMAIEALRPWGKVAAFVSLNPWSSASLDRLAETVGADRLIGFGDGPWTEVLDLDFTCHSSELAFRAARLLDDTLSLRQFRYRPAYAVESARFAFQLREEIGVGPLVVIHRDTKPKKEWLEPNWLELLERLLNQFPTAVIIDVGLAPFSEGLPTGNRERLLHGMKLPLGHALALTGNADLFIGVDSCFLHAADLAGVPMVGLFFATEAHEFGALSEAARNLSRPAPQDLEPLAVYEAVVEVMTRKSQAVRRAFDGASEHGTRALYDGRVKRIVAGSRMSLTLGSVGLGTSRMTFDSDLAVRHVVRRMVELGCNVIDVAGNHGHGEGCAVVGTALSEAFATRAFSRNQVFLCGKAGFTEHLEGRAPMMTTLFGRAASGHDMSPQYLTWEFERQCRWLGVSSLDAFLVQNPEEALACRDRGCVLAEIAAAFTAFEELRCGGRLLFYGVSTAEALRVPPGNPLHLDLAELLAIAEQVGGPMHGFRVLELPVNVAHLEAFETVAHTLPGSDEKVTALAWADRMGMIVLTSASINGAWRLDTLGEALNDMICLDDPAAVQLQLVRSIPGVTTALVGISSLSHVAAIQRLTDVRRYCWQATTVSQSGGSLGRENC